MAVTDYYKILGVDKDATQADIKAAYRKLARKHHPDLNPNDKAAKKKFQQINEANEVLSDPEKRNNYNLYGKDWKAASADEGGKHPASRKGPHPGSKKTRSKTKVFTEEGSFDFEIFADIFGDDGPIGKGGRFSQHFEFHYSSSAGGRSTRKVKMRGVSYDFPLELTIAQAATAHQRTFNLEGEKRRVTIAAGVKDGQVLKMKGLGGTGVHGGEPGNLRIIIAIVDDPHWTLDGEDLYTTVPLDLDTALLGGSIVIDTLLGKVKLKIKPKTRNGMMLRLKGKGFPAYKKEGVFGDLYVTMDVQLPT